jgi:hypothetical protein
MWNDFQRLAGLLILYKYEKMAGSLLHFKPESPNIKAPQEINTPLSRK